MKNHGASVYICIYIHVRVCVCVYHRWVFVVPTGEHRWYLRVYIHRYMCVCLCVVTIIHPHTYSLSLTLTHRLNDDEHGVKQHHATSFPNGGVLGSTFSKSMLFQVLCHSVSVRVC